MTSRVRAWLLLALFLSAGTSLPSADALLHHSHPDSSPGQVHLELPGGCGAHADHCTLGRNPPGSRALAPQLPPVTVALPGCTALAGLPARDPRDARLTLLPPARAPPTPLV